MGEGGINGFKPFQAAGKIRCRSLGDIDKLQSFS